jgi:hypothetical protein
MGICTEFFATHRQVHDVDKHTLMISEAVKAIFVDLGVSKKLVVLSFVGWGV